MFIEKRNFKNSRGLTISAILEGEDREAPAVILCHGFGSAKESESTSNLTQKLVTIGLCVFRFDFTGCGQSEGNLDELTPMQGLDDLKSAVKNLGTDKFALYGSSFGGYVSLVYASENPVLALALKAPVSDYLTVETNKSEQNYNFTRGIKQKVLKEVGDYNLYEEVSRINTPVLIIHGDADPIVPLSQSRKLIEYLKGEKKLEILPGAGHVMDDKDLEVCNTKIANFFAEKLFKRNRVQRKLLDY